MIKIGFRNCICEEGAQARWTAVEFAVLRVPMKKVQTKEGKLYPLEPSRPGGRLIKPVLTDG